MKILGCFKIVPDLDLIAQEDWIADKSLQVDTGYAKLSWNCFDESALEMMLRLSDLSESFDGVHELRALTVGTKRHEPFLKLLYALGYKEAIRVETQEADIRFSPERMAELISGYIEHIAMQDVVVMGTQSSDGNNKKTPFLTAERLGWACFTQVIAMEPWDANHLKIKRQTDIGIETRLVKSPCVLAVGNAPSSYLRVPTLKDKMKYKKKEIVCYDFQDVCRDRTEESTVLAALVPAQKSRDAILIDGVTPEEKARKLYYGYLKGGMKR